MAVKISIEIDGVDVFQPTAASMKPVFNFVYRQLGFLVIGQPRSAQTKFDIGARTNTLMQWTYDEEFEIYAEGKAKDWIAQARLVKLKVPHLALDQLKAVGIFWLVRPLPKNRAKYLPLSPRATLTAGRAPSHRDKVRRVKA